MDTEWSLEELLEAKDDGIELRERESRKSVQEAQHDDDDDEVAMGSAILQLNNCQEYQ